MPNSDLNHQSYTVGWICALPKEMTAAVTMLDEVHSDIGQPSSDYNNYTLGQIGRLNVVIACLPSGEMGNNPAASVATRMIATFPSLDIGLMVGIGGGVPSLEHDIRLGDVVVSVPTDQFGGIVQYDRGKYLKDEKWLRTGFLNSPSAVARTTVAKLMSLHQIRGSRIQECLSEVARKYPKLPKDFFWHSTLTDTLYDAAPCDSEDFTDWVEVPRELRSPDRLIQVHYGLIASGNSVIKSGRRRDQLSKELGGVLCFEMEAAGLMNIFPCVVIRGICDYADAHKHKEWQEHAAMVAAAYAKEFIEALPTPTAALSPQIPTARNTTREKDVDPHLVLPFSRKHQFVGREGELSKLKQTVHVVDACQRVAIVGLGGVGKTQIALEFAYREREIMPDLSIFWVPATEPAAFSQAYQQIAECLQIHGATKDSVDVMKLVKDALSKDDRGHWLLIVDSADDSDMLFEVDHKDPTSLALVEYLPFSRKGSIVFTTRNRKLAVKLAGSNIIQVGLMSPVDSKEVLKGCLLDKELLADVEVSDRLLNLLGYLPLAIVQAAAYINENDMAIVDYTDLYNGSEEDVIEVLSEDFEDPGRYRGVQHSIAKTWLISFNQIQEQVPLAIDYLSLMACLLNHDIPQSILLQESTKKAHLEAIGILVAYSFLVRRPDRKTFDIHRLVHLATRNWLRSTGKLKYWEQKAVECFAKMIPAGGHQDRHVWTPYLPHATHLLASCDSGCRRETFIILSDRLGRCLYSNGQYVEAEQTHQQTHALRVETLGAEHPDTLHSLAFLAEALSHQGKYNAAERIHEQTLDIRRKVLGVEHADVMNSMQYLAQTMIGQGKYNEAEQMHRATRDLRAKALQPEHRSTLTSTSYLAEALNLQGRHEEAEKMHTQILETRIRLFGLSFPATLASMSCLGVTQLNLKKDAAAESTQREVLRLRKTVLGDHHPHTLITQRWLGDALRRRMKYEEAADLLQETLEVQAQLLGRNHPDTIHTLGSLAETSLAQGFLSKASDLYDEVYNRRREILGCAHPETLQSMNDLATFFTRQGDIERVDSLQNDMWELQVEKPHHDNPISLDDASVHRQISREEQI